MKFQFNIYSLVLITLFIIQKIQCELQFVIEIFRHGARGPIFEYYDYEKQLDMMEQLTPGGKKQQYELGRALRKEYIEQQQFLSQQYNHQELKIFSTNVNRTIESVYSQLQGLYPEGTGPVIDDELDNQYIIPPYEGVEPVEFVNKAALQNQFQVFPIHTVTQYDTFLSNTCPNKQQMFLNNIQKNQNIYDEMQKRFQPLMQKYSNYLTQYHGKDIKLTSTNDLWNLYDNFMSSKFQEFELPDILTDEDYKSLELAASFEWFIKYGYGDFNKVTTIEFFKFVINEFEKKISDSSYTYKYIMLSSHDTNIVKILGALGLSSFDCLIKKYDGKLNTEKNQYCFDIPTYASNFIFELHKIDGKNKVKIKYQGNYINLCGNENNECDFEQFKKDRLKYSVENPQKECGFIEIETQEDIQQKQTIESQNESTKTVLYAIIGIQIVLVIFLSVFLFLKTREYKSKKKEDQKEITT